MCPDYAGISNWESGLTGNGWSLGNDLGLPRRPYLVGSFLLSAVSVVSIGSFVGSGFLSESYLRLFEPGQYEAAILLVFMASLSCCT